MLVIEAFLKSQYLPQKELGYPFIQYDMIISEVLHDGKIVLYPVLSKDYVLYKGVTFGEIPE